MKVKDLPSDTSLKGIKVRMPNSIYNNAKLSGLRTRNVYIVGWLMGDFFVKPNLKKDRVFPLLTEHFDMRSILEWEVIKT